MTNEMFFGGLGVLVLISQGTLLGWKIIDKRTERKNGTGAGNGKPGKGTICMGNTKLITEHDISIGHLATAVVDGKEERETIRTENRDDHKSLFDKIDELGKMEK